jgi:hypothetical protein
VLLRKLALQVPLAVPAVLVQLIPAGLEVTVPLPVPEVLRANE